MHDRRKDPRHNRIYISIRKHNYPCLRYLKDEITVMYTFREKNISVTICHKTHQIMEIFQYLNNCVKTGNYRKNIIFLNMFQIKAT